MTQPTVPDATWPWPARVQGEVLATDLVFRERAQRRHPGVRWWWNQRTVEHVHGAWCYLCDQHVATWARRFPVTNAAVKEVVAHRAWHLAQHEREV